MPDASNMFLIVIGMDIESYSQKTPSQQVRVQHKLEEWVASASLNAQLYRQENEIMWVDTGDGGFVLYETQYDKSIRFLSALYRAIKDHNNESLEAANINVRTAVHCDDALKWEGRLGVHYAGNALVKCSRILDAMNRRYSNQVVCSRAFLEKLFTERKPVLEARMPDQVDKHGLSHEVWNIRKPPEFGILPEEDDLHYDPTEWNW